MKHEFYTEDILCTKHFCGKGGFVYWKNRFCWNPNGKKWSNLWLCLRCLSFC